MLQLYTNWSNDLSGEVSKYRTTAGGEVTLIHILMGIMDVYKNVQYFLLFCNRNDDSTSCAITRLLRKRRTA